MELNRFLLGLSLSIAWAVASPWDQNNGVHSPWFYDADNYWDFDSVVGHVVEDLKGDRRSRVIGNYSLFPGPKDNALELLETKKRSYIELGDFSQTCLPDPSKCQPGFTISFWVSLKKVLNDGVLLQIGMSRKSRGITINTHFKEGRIFLIFYGNTRKRMYTIKAELSSHIWHHVVLVWNATAKPKMSLFVNCTSRDDFKAKVKKVTAKKREDKMLILGANHAGRKAIPIAVDDFAIWFKVLKQERFCEIINQERVHGNYSLWSDYSSCSVGCGLGTKTRKRVCNNPIPDYGGRSCSKLGPSSQTVECNTRPCPIPGGYTSWSDFSECSVSCGGGGTRYRTRNCTNPKPQYGGQDCSDIGPAMETVDCGERPCPIPGGYTSWSNFSECSVSCGGGGLRYRTRNCTNPKPQYGGQDCSDIGPAMETVDCGERPCPIPGGYTSWSNFSECSVSCGGGGSRYRTRNCTKPKPQYGGKNCFDIGPSMETVECNTRPCPIPGGYTSWSNFSECSVSCGGGGTRYRTRNCTKPKPQFGGQDCSDIGPAMETVNCNERPCPIPGGYTSWSNFSECSVSCGGGGSRYRTRNCTNPNPQYGGQDCSDIGPAVDTADCGERPCPIPGGYTSWSNFSECSVSCGGGGLRYRTRNCTNPKPQYGGKNCSDIGPSMETVECGDRPCPVSGGYTPWSNFSECSVSCGGGGTQYRTRNCSKPEPKYGGQDCSEIGPSMEIVKCGVTPCPVHGNYSAWSAFTACSTSCGLGFRTRNRTCTDPAPRFGGQNCLGLDYEIRSCNLRVCPIHGGYSQWSNFSICSLTCGNSTKSRTRICNNPTPSFGGRDCRELGPNSVTVLCDTQPCPVNGNYSDWSEFSPCSKTCGNSFRFRRRFCTNPAPRFGGENCSVLGVDFEEFACSKAPCPIHGNFSEWSEFSRCSRTCGNSFRKRHRNCTRPTPMHGGNDCSSLGISIEVVNCDVPECPIDGNYSEWTIFSTCSRTCGNGTRFRTRHCDNPLPQFGGKNCSTLGSSNETRQCNTRPCPIHGNLSEWSEFSGCSKTCGSGFQTRHRYCTNPEPKYGGTNCSVLGPASDVISCHVRFCPIHGNYSTWSSFGPCSKSCDNGTQIRRRFCTKPSPRFGGRDCHILGPDAEARLCETQPCPDIDFTVTFKLNHLLWTDELLDNSSHPRQDLSDELKTAIFGLHKSKAIKDVKILKFSPGSVVVSMEVVYYSLDFPGAISLHDALYESRKIGSYEVTPLQFTSTDVPTNFVQNLTALNQSSTSLMLYWSALSRQQGQSAIKGYAVIYEELQWPSNLKSNKTRISIFLNTTRGRLNQLKKYTWYRTRISGMNKRGIGVPSEPFLVLTDEDVPNASPNLKPIGYNTSSTSLNISWKAIARSDINGVLRGYTLFYKPSSSHEIVRNITVASDKLYVHLTGLRKYTKYELRVAGVTSKGTGEVSTRSLLSTDEDVPSASPVFHSYGYNNSTSILLQWYKVVANHQNGFILGYRIYYRANSSSESWDMISVRERETRLIVNRLKMFTKYLFRISAFTKKGEGNVSESILVSTDEDVPCSAPKMFEADVINSTSVWLKWTRLPVSCYRGILRGYILFYKKKSESLYLNVSVPPTSSDTVLDNLRKFTVYHIHIAGFTSKGLGPVSQDIAVQTEEDVPSTWPESIHAHNTSSTSIQVVWSPIPRSRIHGILRGYHIFLRKANESEWEGKIPVSESDLSKDIGNLLKYTKYVLKIVGFTAVGAGAASPEITVQTDEDVPSHPPEQFKTINKSSPTSIPLTWKPISNPFYIHGILLGYKIEFKMTHLGGNALTGHDTTVVHTTGPNSLSHVLTGLEIYAVYRIKIRALTVKGDGVSTEISAETCRCTSIYKTNWWINPPYIYKNNSKISGIFPRILPRMVSKCCGYCHEHKRTVTRFENPGTSNYRKSGVLEFRDHVEDTTELHFPMYGQVYQVKYYKQYEFIPMVESPGVVFLVLEDDKHIASMLLLDTIGRTLPVVLLMVAFILVFGIVMWCVESFSNKSQFPRSLFSGVHQGIWWSMVSMTTIGYGDKFPRSVAGKILGIFWILAGSIIMSLYTSVVTSHITTEVVAEKVKLYGMKVAVIQNSSEHQLAVRKNAHPDLEHSYNNLYDIYNALTNGYVRGALVDAYVLGSRRDLFENTKARINKIYDYSSAYGVVLAGEAKKLQKCFREYVSENRKDIFQIIEENVNMIEESDISASVQRAKSLIDPTFFVYKQCLFICVVLLCLAVVLGILLDHFRRSLNRTFCRVNFTADMSKKRAELLTAQKTLQHEMKKDLFELSQKLKRLKNKHRRELKQWIKVKKSLGRDRLLTDDSLVYSASVVRYDEPYQSPLLQLRKLIDNSSNSDENSPRGSECERETIV